ncbi:protein TOPLESS-RELATED PROTEIN 2-like isoform X2 [Henckelia pumila]|uniref:protein TOPLESS-RELATED PROTEIN 2-like isoform X2 n=1 Tax=Henckelia pumila TaxID=405737 RepID=UPI003C6DCEF2
MAAEGDSGKLRADISLLSNNVDLLSEILLRLPSKSLMRFNVVCKSWRALIMSRYFRLLWRQKIKYFEDQVQAGEWEEVERYLSRFLKVNDNDESKTIFTEIMKQKFFENLVREQKEIFSEYSNIMSQRKFLIGNLRRYIDLNPFSHDKSEFPPVIEASSLRKMIESHKIQHVLCKDSNPSPDGDHED